MVPCIIKNFVFEITKGCFSRKEQSEAVYNYVDKKVPLKRIRIKKLSIDEIVEAALNRDKLTLKEKALLIHQSLIFIHEM